MQQALLLESAGMPLLHIRVNCTLIQRWACIPAWFCVPALSRSYGPGILGTGACENLNFYRNAGTQIAKK